ncbi:MULTISPECIES: hypothetical protein [Spirulina sp. CCY15215]|uniref:hypothetical protein n=1 Tax=Spirulina sp. CCY15215 TaxID=2767591 RepID=UPI00195078F3|nr:hypothetical protein [Spirulina major]
MKDPYPYILQGLEESPDFYDSNVHQTFADYLISLQESARNLWSSYRSIMVNVDYSDPKIQAVYLVRYYPHYVQMTLEVLRLSPEIFTFGQEINACFFGAGPCPEVAGLAQFLIEHSQKTQSIIAHVYDVDYELWKPGRKITQNFVLPGLWNNNIDWDGKKLDLESANSFESIKDIISNSNLFVFQNCLNEIWNRSIVKNNIEILLEYAPINSFIIIVDLSGYYVNQKMMEDIVEIIEERNKTRNDYKIVGKSKELNVISSLQSPDIVKKYLLTGEDKLIAKKRINFLFLTLRKGEYISDDLLDDIG